MNKKNIIILVAFLICLTGYSQVWKYDSGGNAFDGKYRSANVIGTCSDFPYNKPALCLNIFKERNMNLYIANSGYYSDENDVQIMFIFSNEPKTIYYSGEISLSKDKETIFLLSFKSGTSRYLDRIDFINKLKKSSRLDVRIKSEYKNRDIKFSLSGSTKALNYVLTKNYLNHLSKIEEEIESNVREEELKLDSIAKVQELKLDSIAKANEIEKLKEGASIVRIESILSELGINKNETSYTINDIKRKATVYRFNLSEISKIESSTYKTIKFIKLSLYDTNNKLLHWFSIKLPQYFNKLIIEKKRNERLIKVKDSLNKIEFENKLFESPKKTLLKLIERFNLSLDANQSVLNKYQETYNKKWFDFKNIDSVNIIKPQKKGIVLMRIYYQNDWIVTLDDIDVTDKYRKKMRINKAY
jgi:hypothetical protein